MFQQFNLTIPHHVETWTGLVLQRRKFQIDVYFLSIIHRVLLYYLVSNWHIDSKLLNWLFFNANMNDIWHPPSPLQHPYALAALMLWPITKVGPLLSLLSSNI